jgi:hypothetical protein
MMSNVLCGRAIVGHARFNFNEQLAQSDLVASNAYPSNHLSHPQLCYFSTRSILKLHASTYPTSLNSQPHGLRLSSGFTTKRCAHFEL